MTNDERRRYKAYVREFRELKREGCHLYYPDQHEISPRELAAVMVRDASASYMRDPSYDKEGKVMRIDFHRVE